MGPETTGLSRRSAARGAIAAGLALAVGARAAAAQGTPSPTGRNRCPGDLRPGSAIAVTGPEGTEELRLTVAAVADPFTGHDPDDPPDRRRRYVALELRATATGERPLTLDPTDFLLQDAEGYLYKRVLVGLPDDAPVERLERAELDPGGEAAGLLVFALPDDAPLGFLFYQPELSRLLVAADLRDGAGA